MDDRYGPRKTVITVVLNALIAQSNIAQPKISRLSLTKGLEVDVMSSLLKQNG
jgi:hypothetical protein